MADHNPQAPLIPAELDRVFDIGQRVQHRVSIRTGHGIHIDRHGRLAASPRWVATGFDWLLLVATFWLAVLIGVLIERYGWVSRGIWLLGAGLVIAFALGWALRAWYRH